MKYLFLFFILFAGNLKAQSVYDSNIDWSNPAFIAGSNLPELFQRYYLMGDYNSMLELTSNKSRERYGDENLIDYFKNMKFGYTFKLKNRLIGKDKIHILYALAEIHATKAQVKFLCEIENQYSKIIITNVDTSEYFPLNQK